MGNHILLLVILCSRAASVQFLLGVYQSAPTSKAQHEVSGLVFLRVDMQRTNTVLLLRTAITTLCNGFFPHVVHWLPRAHAMP